MAKYNIQVHGSVGRVVRGNNAHITINNTYRNGQLEDENIEVEGGDEKDEDYEDEEGEEDENETTIVSSYGNISVVGSNSRITVNGKRIK